MADLKITTLSENRTQRRGLIAEHGLAFLLEYHGSMLMFDTGQGSSLVANAETLAIDLDKLQAIILSHGHYDHTGGLYSLLRKIGPRDIYAHPAALKMKYRKLASKHYRATGIPNSPAELAHAGANFIANTKPTELMPGLIITGEIPRLTSFEGHHPLYFLEEDGDYVFDSLLDDQALAITTAKGLVVVTGCAHAGLVNTLDYATKLTGNNTIYALIGGTHLQYASNEQRDQAIQRLKHYQVEIIAANHCTGFDAQMMLRQAFGHQFVINSVGDMLEF